MSLDNPEHLAIDGAGRRVALIAARYNFEMVNALLESVLKALDAAGVKQEDVETFRVPGSNEIPHIAAMVAKGGTYDVVIALGVVVAGETDHHTIITRSTAAALHSIGVEFEVPVINGIISVGSTAQAEARISGEHARGPEFAHAALEMAQLNDTLQRRFLDADLDMDALDWLDELDDIDDDEDDSDDWKK